MEFEVCVENENQDEVVVDVEDGVERGDRDEREVE